MTDLVYAPPITIRQAKLPALPTLAFGALGGCALGIIARAWMRLISEEPDFTWSGTIFIVAGFTIFGFAQSIAAVVRSRDVRLPVSAIVRTFGTISMLPLFAGAGALMLPTAVGGGLAMARVNWPPIARCLCLVLAGAPVVYVGNDLADAFGWSLRWLAGVLLMLGVYGAIVWATRFTLAARLDGWRLRR
jgi:hypothetical protein